MAITKPTNRNFLFISVSVYHGTRHLNPSLSAHLRHLNPPSCNAAANKFSLSRLPTPSQPPSQNAAANRFSISAYLHLSKAEDDRVSCRRPRWWEGAVPTETRRTSAGDGAGGGNGRGEPSGGGVERPPKTTPPPTPTPVKPRNASTPSTPSASAFSSGEPEECLALAQGRLLTSGAEKFKAPPPITSFLKADAAVVSLSGLRAPAPSHWQEAKIFWSH